MRSLRVFFAHLSFSDWSSFQYLEELVKVHHKKWTAINLDWSYQSTRQKLLSAYWTRIVPLHIFAIICLSVSLSGYAIFKHADPTTFIVVVSLVAAVTYLVLRFCLYSPIFTDDYIPMLDCVIGKLQGNDSKASDETKKAQYSAVTLVLIHLVVNKLAGFSKLPSIKETKEQMTKLYGVSERSFHDALNAVLNADWKHSKRMDTEMADAFKAAGHYFLENKNQAAVNLLSHIQSDLLVSKRPPEW
ncbi:MAG: hypothetical protein V4450_09390 [Bacteroidota bacterium]